MIETTFPIALLFLPLGILLLYLFSRKSRTTISRKTGWASFGLRSLLLTGLLGGMAQPYLVSDVVDPERNLFLLDVSESISEEDLQKAITHIETQSSKAPSAVIGFAGKAKLLHPLSQSRLEIPRTMIYENISGKSGIRRETFETNKTNFTNALHLATTLGWNRHKLTLISDGQDPLGTASPEFLASALPQKGPKRDDAAVIGIRHPLAIRSGEPFDVRIDLFSTSRIPIDLLLQIDQNQWKKEEQTLLPGKNTILFSSLTGKMSGGSHTLQVFLQAGKDREKRNNFATSPIIVMGKARILLLEEIRGEADNLKRILDAHQFETQVLPPTQLPSTSLDHFNAVCSVGLPASSLPAEVVERIQTFVENGGGFWFIAKGDRTAAMEYATSPIADLLPVQFDPTPVDPKTPQPRESSPPTKERRPSPTIALLLVIDKSGSMAGRKLELVKEACRVTGDTLSAEDSIGVIAFDAKPKWALPFTSPSQKEHIRDRIYRILAEGGTDIYPALQEAYRGMLSDPRAQNAGIKHIILFSDGDTREADFRTLVTNMAKDGITVSTVCILRGKFDPILMNNIAHFGKGRFASTGSFSQVPKIFTEEARALLREVRNTPRQKEDPTPPPLPPPLRREGKELQPYIRKTHGILWEKPPLTLPPLTGILKATEKPHAKTPLAIKGEGVLLTIGRRGLGKVAVWTSDLSGLWSAQWIRWTPFGPQLFAQLLRHLTDSGRDLDFSSRINLSRMKTKDRIRISPGMPGEKITLHTIQPEMEELRLQSGSEGTLVADLPHREDPVSYRVQKTVSGSVEKLVFQIMPPYPPEFSPPRHRPKANLNKMESPPAERETKLKQPLAIWIFLGVMGLFPLDILIRRWK